MRRLSRPLVMLAVLFPVVTSTPRPRVHVNLTPSLPRGVYVETSEPLIRGVLVIECLTPEVAAFAKERGYLGSGHCPGHMGSVLKRIEGLPGNKVELANEYVAINGRLILISKTLEKDAEGRELPRLPRSTFVLGPDEYFLMAEYSRSWDDRYKGPTARQNIRQPSDLGSRREKNEHSTRLTGDSCKLLEPAPCVHLYGGWSIFYGLNFRSIVPGHHTSCSECSHREQR